MRLPLRLPLKMNTAQHTKDLLKKVRLIELKTRGLSDHIFSGEYHSAFKGRGMAFSEVREYTPGDEVRTIDWNVTARFGHPFVKVFEEERELTVVLVADVSGSGDFGTTSQTKRELITEVCATLAFSAIKNNDKVGLILFSDQVELFIPPKKGRSHILRLVRELLEFRPAHRGTDIAEALRYLNSVIKKRSIAFLISDLMGQGYDDALKIANRRHDLVVLRTGDPGEGELPFLDLRSWWGRRGLARPSPGTGPLSITRFNAASPSRCWKVCPTSTIRSTSSSTAVAGVSRISTAYATSVMKT